MPVAKTRDLGRLPPRDPLRHRPLHGGLRVGVRAWQGLLLSPPEKRTFHVLSQPDHITGSRHARQLQLTPLPACAKLLAGRRV